MAFIRPLCWLLVLLLTLPASAAPLNVVIPPGDSPGDTRYDEYKEVLRLALEETVPSHGPYTLSEGEYMTAARWMVELQKGGEINLAWNATSEERERDLLPIRVPLSKGLLGYRIALIDERRQADLDRVTTLDELRRLVVGQGIGWGDVKVYENVGVRVVVAPYESLFRMVTSDRFDLFPRGVGEVFHEYEERRMAVPHLAVEKRLLLYYPWPYYFFVNRKDAALAERVAAGLQRMRADGSFDAVFWKYHRAAIEQANLKGRRIIRLANPLLPKETPLADSSLWFDPLRDAPPAATRRDRP